MYGHSRVIATLEVTDLVIVDTADAVLVATRTKSRTSRVSSTGSMNQAGPRPSSTGRSTGPGVSMTRSIPGTGSRSSGLQSTRAEAVGTDAPPPC